MCCDPITMISPLILFKRHTWSSARHSLPHFATAVCALFLVLAFQIGCSPSSTPPEVEKNRQVRKPAAVPPAAETHSEPCDPNALKSLHVASYNIRAGKGTDGIRDLSRTAKLLGNTDFVGMQEVDNGRLRSGFEDQAEVIASYLGHDYAKHFPAETYTLLQGGGSYGNAATSSLRVLESDMFDLPRILKKPLRRLAWVKFEVNCEPVHAFVIHVTNAPGTSGTVQWTQIEAALAIIDEKVGNPPEPHIFMGDFNALPNGYIVKQLRKRFTDALLTRAPETYAGPHVDYIFVAGDLEVLEAGHVFDGSSDHPAVFTTVRPPVHALPLKRDKPAEVRQ
jgi:endonuclease/exonuclease/phosphatase family metal-dependent hydrolase